MVSKSDRVLHMLTGRISPFLFWDAFRIPRRGRSDSHLFQLLYWAVLISVILSLHTAVVFTPLVLYWNSCPSRGADESMIFEIFVFQHPLWVLSPVLWLVGFFIQCGGPNLCLPLNPLWLFLWISADSCKNCESNKRNSSESTGLLTSPSLFPFCSSSIVPPWQLEWITPTMLHTLCFQFSGTRAVNQQEVELVSKRMEDDFIPSWRHISLRNSYFEICRTQGCGNKKQSFQHRDFRFNIEGPLPISPSGSGPWE